MIHIKLELWPNGDKSRAQDLGSATVANESNLSDISSYSIRLLKGKYYSPNNPGTLWRSGELSGWPRTSKEIGPWELLFLLLQSALGNRISLAKKLCLAGRKKTQTVYAIGLTEDGESYGMTHGPFDSVDYCLARKGEPNGDKTPFIIRFKGDDSEPIYIWDQDSREWVSLI